MLPGNGPSLGEVRAGAGSEAEARRLLLSWLFRPAFLATSGPPLPWGRISGLGLPTGLKNTPVVFLTGNDQIRALDFNKYFWGGGGLGQTWV